MKVRVIYFSSLKEKLKISSEDIDFDGETLKDLKDEISSIHPDVSELLDRSIFAVNEEYCDLNKKIKSEDIIAVIPPVSGG